MMRSRRRKRQLMPPPPGELALDPQYERNVVAPTEVRRRKPSS